MATAIVKGIRIAMLARISHLTVVFDLWVIRRRKRQIETLTIIVPNKFIIVLISVSFRISGILAWSMVAICLPRPS